MSKEIIRSFSGSDARAVVSPNGERITSIDAEGKYFSVRNLSEKDLTKARKREETLKKKQDLH